MAFGDCPVCGKPNNKFEEIKLIVKDADSNNFEIMLPHVHLLCLLQRAGIAKAAEG